MKRILPVLILLAIAQALYAQNDAPKEGPPFEPAEIVSLTDLVVPLSSIASGILVLDAVVSEAGEVQKVEIRRGIDSLTESAVSSIEGWKFSPATLEGKSIACRVPVAVTVRPALHYVEPMPLPELKPQTEAAVQAAFQPAEVLHATFPAFAGETSVGPVTAVLEVKLSEEGKAGDMKVLVDAPGATAACQTAVADWRFMAATLNGKPVPSKIILMFVLRPPTNWLPQ